MIQEQCFPIPIPKELSARLTDLVITKSLRPGQVLLEAGEPVFYLPIVCKGLLKVMREDEDQREILLYHIRPGESCAMSYHACTQAEPSTVKALAIEESEVLLLPHTELPYLWKEENWRQFILQQYHQRFEGLMEALEAFAFRRLDQRLWQYLEHQRQLSQTDQLHLTHQEIAQDLGTTREVISRLLKQLEREGQLQLGRNQITFISQM